MFTLPIEIRISLIDMRKNLGRKYSRALKSLLVLVVLYPLAFPAYAIDRRQEILDQQDGCVITDPELIAELQALNAQVTWVELSYLRFDVFIDSAYYDHNTPAIDVFFDLFEPRFDLLEANTGWSSESSFAGTKLEIFATGTVNCWSGFAVPGEAHLSLSDPLNRVECERASYENGNSSFGNPGELGDFWIYMNGALHEASHSISPLGLFVRPWLTEGFAEYLMHNTLSENGDINQETADTYIFNGDPTRNWTTYVANDYHDSTFEQHEIQESRGYDITAWMFSMLRDDYLLDWNNFYSILNNNLETLEESRLTFLGYKADTHVLDVFGRALGHTNFETQTKPIFRYDGPSGPGWGVRNIVSLDWYADLSVNISLSDTLPNPADTIDVYATVHNTGDVSLDSVDVLITVDTNLTYEVFVNLPAHDSVVVSTQFAIPGELNVISAIVDRNNRKIELDDSNNTDTLFASLGCCSFPGDANNSGSVNIADVTFLIARIFAGGQAPVCNDEADANGSDTVNIADVTFLIARIFAGGSAPVCGTTGS